MLNQEVRDIWDANAAFWDARMGQEGNDHHRLLVGPAQERLLGLRQGDLVLDSACGTGLFSRRMADLGCRVVACDIAEQMRELAKGRSKEYGERIEYLRVDATDGRQLLALGEHRFDSAVCGMALMDIPEVKPMLFALTRLLKPDGHFVFSVMHPCFNFNGVVRLSEMVTEGTTFVTRQFLKLPASYIAPAVSKGAAVSGQPELQYYFARPLSALLAVCFEAGFVVDGMEEPVFAPEEIDPANLWAISTQIPPVLAVRLRRSP